MNAHSSEALSILDILSKDSIKVPFDVDDKTSAIDGLIELLGEQGHIDDVDEVKHVVWERENQRSTGIGEGIAIPHGKSDKINKLVLAIGIPTNPIEFGSIDGKPVKLLALLISPTDRIAEHIQALGRISRLMSSEEFRESACTATSAEELYEKIRAIQG